MSSLISGGLAFWCREFVRHQLRPNQPPVVRAKVAAGNFAFRGDLDSRAALNRDRACSRYPLIDRGRRHIERIGQRALAAKYVTGFLDCVHGANFSSATDYLQAMLQNFADSIAK